MRELTIHLIGNRALKQHNHHVTGSFWDRGDVEIDNALSGIAWGPKIDAIFIHRRRAAADLINQRQEGTAEGNEITQQMPTQNEQRHFEKIFGRHVGVSNATVRPYHQYRVRQRIEHKIGELGSK
jgi:hypothetical protein